jgi:hypothetical protein
MWEDVGIDGKIKAVPMGTGPYVDDEHRPILEADGHSASQKEHFIYRSRRSLLRL